MNKNGKKILLLVKDPEISGSARKLCCHHAGEVDARMLDLESIDHAVSSQWNLLVLHIDSTLADRDVCGQIKAANPLGQIIVVADEADRTLGLDWTTRRRAISLWVTCGYACGSVKLPCSKESFI